MRGPLDGFEFVAGGIQPQRVAASGSTGWDHVHIGDQIRISRDGLPLGEPRGILIQVANPFTSRIHAHRQTNLQEVPEEVELPIDHRQLERVGEPHTGRFADLDAPAILQGRKQNDDDRRHHDGGRQGTRLELKLNVLRLRLELVTDSLNREKEPRLLRLWFELLPQTCDVRPRTGERP